MSLRAWQEALQAHILDGDPGILDLLRTDGDPASGLDIYASGYRSRLLEALVDSYPGLHALVGDAPLLEFIARHPPQVSNLRGYGGALAGWLRQRPHGREAAASMADLEWALATVFLAADGPVATRQQLAEIPPEKWPGIRFRPAAASCRLSLPAGLVDWRRQLLEGAAPAELERLGRPESWLLWRQDHVVRQRPLHAEEVMLMDGVSQGESLASLCERLAGLHPPGEVPLRLVEWVGRWLDEGWIAALQPAPEPSADGVAQQPHQATADHRTAP
ncbi:HvfC/BufC family peptide modification chaperone [Frateuria aurantia]